MGTKVWISVRSPNSRTVNIALFVLFQLYTVRLILIFSAKVFTFSDQQSMNVFYTIFYFPNNKYIATFVSAFGQGFVFWVENIGQNHVPYNKIIKLKNDGAKPAYKFIRNETLYIDTAIFREKVCTLFRTFLYPYLHCSNHRKFV